MKKILQIAALTAITSIGAFADGVCVSASGTITSNGLAPSVANSISGGGAICTLADGQEFSNFQEYAAGGFNGNNALLQVSVSGNNLVFTTLGLATEDVNITFQTVNGGVGSAFLNTGPGDVVTEFICGAAFTEPGETCNGGNLITSNPNFLMSSSGNPSGGQFATVAFAATDFFLKDDSGGSGFTEGFAPEPMSMSLMGLGLLGIGLAARKFRK